MTSEGRCARRAYTYCTHAHLPIHAHVHTHAHAHSRSVTLAPDPNPTSDSAPTALFGHEEQCRACRSISETNEFFTKTHNLLRLTRVGVALLCGPSQNLPQLGLRSLSPGRDRCRSTTDGVAEHELALLAPEHVHSGRENSCEMPPSSNARVGEIVAKFVSRSHTFPRRISSPEIDYKHNTQTHRA